MMVSPLHAMFIDGVLIPAASLCNGSSIRQLDSVHYFHVELDSHDIILAEGAPSETFVDDDSRGMFHNAAEYRALYPKAASVAAHYCAPRVEDGEALECVRRRLAARLSPAGVMRVPGDLQGYLDEAGRDLIRGWAFEPDGPDTPVRLRIFDNGAVIGEVIADRYREDLAKAGIGNGCHGFELIVAGGLSPAVGHVIEVVRSADGRALSNSPWITAQRRQA